jgi:uncharacterized MnhB-related membrane protein
MVLMIIILSSQVAVKTDKSLDAAVVSGQVNLLIWGVQVVIWQPKAG